MRIGIPATLPGTALDNIMKPVVNWLREAGHYVEYTHIKEWKNYDFDLIHLSYAHILPDDIACPVTVQVNHIEIKKETTFMSFLYSKAPARVIVADRFWQQRLGMWEIPRVRLIPLTFYHSKFQPLPHPPEFTVGWLGTDYPYKRFNVALQAAKDLGIPFVDGARKDKLEAESPTWDPDPLGFHKKISCYIVTTFTDTGPLPPQEALLCDRPVISTTVGMMPDIIKPGYNGEFFDGSIEDLKKKILHVKERFSLYRPLQHTTLPSIETVGRAFEKLFEEVIEENQ